MIAAAAEPAAIFFFYFDIDVAALFLLLRRIKSILGIIFILLAAAVADRYRQTDQLSGLAGFDESVLIFTDHIFVLR